MKNNILNLLQILKIFNFYIITILQYSIIEKKC